MTCEIKKTQLKQSLLQMMGSVVAPRSAIYVAGPLETCWELYEERVSTSEQRDKLRLKNQKRLSEYCVQLRRLAAKPVIDPGILRCNGWDGADYGDLFIDILKIYASEARFIDGWEYSNGASKEFVACQEVGIPCLNSFGQLISISDAVVLIQNACENIERVLGDATRLKTRITSLLMLTQ